jgi:hypothetical protein
MKRDFDLIRKILLTLEESPRGHDEITEIDGYPDEVFGYHGHLLHEAGLVVAYERECMGLPMPYANPYGLTWDGHEFLDLIKKDTLWEKAKSTILKHSSGLAFAVLQDWAKSEILHRASLP